MPRYAGALPSDAHPREGAHLSAARRFADLHGQARALAVHDVALDGARVLGRRQRAERPGGRPRLSFELP